MSKTRILFLGIVVFGVISTVATIFEVNQVREIALTFALVLVGLLVLIIHRYLVKNRAYSNKQFKQLSTKIDDFVEAEDSLSSANLVQPVGNGPLKRKERKGGQGKGAGSQSTVQKVNIGLNSRSFSSSKAFAALMKGRARAVEKFALNSQSESIRDSICLTASSGECNYEEIQSNVDAFLAGNESAGELIKQWDMRWLLLLARVLSNQRFTSRDIDNSARIFESVSIVFGTDKFGERDRLLFAEVLQDRGDFDAALDLLKDGNIDSSDPIQFGLVGANKARIIDASQKLWLRHINSIYKKCDLSTLYLSPECTGTPLDRLSSGTNSGVIDGPLVSVLIPTFNGASRIHTALASLKAQTWSQIEIIVIDDGSTESNNEKLRSVCAGFSNVTLIEQGKNLGAYEARNRGLHIARGDFITVHDDDDWSHPQKIAMQVQHLLNHPQFAANTTKHVRVTEDLEFTRINSNPTYVQDNFSSLMFRKSIVQKIGSWDVANRGADEEFKNRIVKIGGFKIAAVGKCPMSFTRTHVSSLTSGELFRGYQDPARLIYHAAYKLGHKAFLSGSSAGLSDFVRPLNMQPGNRGKEFGKFDAVFAGDFSSLTPQLVRAIYEAEVLAKSGKRIAFLYLHSPFVDENPNVTDELLQSAKNIGFEFLTLADRAMVESLIVIDPAVLVFAENLKTNLEVTESAIRLESPLDRSQVAPTIALDQSVENLEKIFGVEPIVFFTEEGGLNEQIRLIYHTVKFSDSNWKSFRSLPLSQPKTCEPDRLPIIGRHSTNTNTPWPEILEEIRIAYVQPDLALTRIYEDISHLSQKVQELLTSGAEIVSTEHVPLTDYLDSLDFWVVQFSGRNLRTIPSGVYDALCRGLVVILPPEFEPIFGNAALYSKPKQVPNLVRRVWGTRILYEEQSKRATEFAQGLSSADKTRPLVSAR